MEAVKDYLDCVNVHWIVVVTTGMYMHLRQICIIGLCLDEEPDPPFDPSYASVIFIFSVLCLLAEYKLWPSSLKEPPIQLLYIYEVKHQFRDSFIYIDILSSRSSRLLFFAVFSRKTHRDSLRKSILEIPYCY